MDPQNILNSKGFIIEMIKTGTNANFLLKNTLKTDAVFTIYMAVPLFLPQPKNQGKNNLSKVHSLEQPQNYFPHPVLTYHFLVLIGALVHIIFFYTTQKNTRYNYNYIIYSKRKYIASTNLSFFNSSNYGTVGSMLSATAIRNLENFYEKFIFY